MPSEIEKLNMRCQYCKYKESVGEVFYCKRNPPARDELGQGKWPKVRFDDYCGEFKQNKKKPDEQNSAIQTR